MRSYYTYILSNARRTALYVGVAGNLESLVRQHKERVHPESFTARYHSDRLMYFEEYGDVFEAIDREKQLKAGSRRKKVELIEKDNPDWNDLSAQWYD